MRYAIVGRQVAMASTICMVTAPVVGSSFELFSFGAISLFSSHPHLYIASFSLQVMSLRHGSFSSAGGPFCMSRKVLAGQVLDIPNHISTYLLVHASFLYGLTVCEH